MGEAQQYDANRTALFGTDWLLQSALQNAGCNSSATNKVAVPCPVQARWPVNNACHALTLLTCGHGPPPECIRSLPESPALASYPMLFPLFFTRPPRKRQTIARWQIQIRACQDLISIQSVVRPLYGPMHMGPFRPVGASSRRHSSSNGLIGNPQRHELLPAAPF